MVNGQRCSTASAVCCVSCCPAFTKAINQLGQGRGGRCSSKTSITSGLRALIFKIDPDGSGQRSTLIGNFLLHSYSKIIYCTLSWNATCPTSLICVSAARSRYSAQRSRTGPGFLRCSYTGWPQTSRCKDFTGSHTIWTYSKTRYCAGLHCVSSSTWALCKISLLFQSK